MKKITPIIFILFCTACFSQSAGYMGKQFILKTDVLYGKYVGFKNIEAEYLFANNWSVSIGVRQHEAQYKHYVSLRDLYYLVEGSTPQGSFSYNNNLYNVELPKTTISFVTYKIMVKNYFSKIWPKPPKGWYWGMMYEWGTAKLTGGTLLIPSFSTDRKLSFAYKNNVEVNTINTRFYELSLGYQEIFKNVITADFGVALNYSRFNSNGDRSTLRVTSLSARYVGPNLYTVPKSTEEGDLNNPPYKSAFGLSAYIKIGYLIF